MSYKKIISNIDEDFIRSGSVTQEDIDRVQERARDIQGKVDSGGPLKRFARDVRLLLKMLHDYFAGRYPHVPYGSIVAIVFALAYVLSPLDLIPDFIPIVGLMDDAAVLAVCISLVGGELKAYRAWLQEHQTLA